MDKANYFDDTVEDKQPKIGKYNKDLFVPKNVKEDTVPVVKQRTNYQEFMRKRKEEEERIMSSLKQNEEEQKVPIKEKVDNLLQDSSPLEGIKSRASQKTGDGILKFVVSKNTISIEDLKEPTIDGSFINLNVGGYNAILELVGFTEEPAAIFCVTGMEVYATDCILKDDDNNCYFLIVPVNEFDIDEPVVFKIGDDKATICFKESNKIIEKVKILDIYGVRVSSIN